MTSHPFRARKRFGQHFLTDQGVLGSIIHAIKPTTNDHMVEIGPGLGALTDQLLPNLSHLTVVEVDRDLAARWNQRVPLLARAQPPVALTVIQADVLTVDFGALAQTQPLRIVGNLPYNISSPILFHLLQARHRVIDQHFMLQKEVIDRMIAPPNDAAYGRLSVMMQTFYEQTYILDVGPEAFDPPPRVDSAVIRMIPRIDTPPQLSFALLEHVVKLAFSQRRKLLKSTLGAWAATQGYSGDFDFNRRAQEVSPAEFVALSLALAA